MKILLYIFLLSFSGSIFCQLHKQELLNMQMIYQGQNYSKINFEQSEKRFIFSFTANSIPSNEFKEKQYSRIYSLSPKIIKIFEHKSTVTLVVSEEISKEALEKTFLFLSRLYGNIGYKIIND